MSGYHERGLETFPMHKIKRVDRPTIRILDDQVKRMDDRDGGFNKAAASQYGPVLEREYKRFIHKHPLSLALINMQFNLTPLGDGPVASQKAPIPDSPALLSRHIKETAYFLRADAVGICELPPYAVYTNRFPTGEPVELKHKYAIAILIDQDWRTANAYGGHDYISNSMSFMGYSASGFIAAILANYIRNLGYPARAHYSRNYLLMVPPILLWAGMGEMCRIGNCVLHPFLGPRFKASVVTTDLPLLPDKPIDFGLQDFCSKCKKCAEACPSQALSYEGKVMYNGYEHWHTDIRKCTTMRVGNQRGSGCGTCIKVCPWNKPYTPFHRAVNWAIRRSRFARRFAKWGDDLMGYGKANPDDKWWFDLEDIEGNGTFTTPAKNVPLIKE